MKITVIIVTYNSEKVIGHCIDTLIQTLNNFEKEIVVVDNASSDSTREILVSRFPTVKLVSSELNLGFGKAINLGVLGDMGNMMGIGGMWDIRGVGEIILVINPDVFLNGSIDKIIKLMGSVGDLGVVGIKLVNPETKLIQPYICGYRQTFWRLLRENLGLGEKPWLSTKSIEVDWITGAAMFIQKAAFVDIQGFDEKIFLFFEDQDFCIRAKNKGWRVLYYPLVKEEHGHGKSSFESEKRMKQFYYQSQDYFFGKYYGRLSVILLRSLRKLFGL